MKLKDIAAEISAALARWEADPTINAPRASHGNTRPYYHAGALASSTRVIVVYISYQGAASLTRAQALRYLDWIKAGFVGQHYSVPEAEK